MFAGIATSALQRLNNQSQMMSSRAFHLRPSVEDCMGNGGSVKPELSLDQFLVGVRPFENT
jgi:hypothetical protein